MSKHQLLLVIAAVSLFVVFLIGFLPNSPVFIGIKLLFLFILLWGVFFYSRVILALAEEEESEEVEETRPQRMPTSENPEDYFKIRSSQNVEEYFRQFLETIFPLIKQTLVCNTVVLLMVNFYKKQFYIRYKLTDFEAQFTRESFLDLKQGLLAFILKDKKPLLENHLPDSERLLPYYAAPRIPARAFAGAPLYYKDLLVGILCVDSEVEESFGEEDLAILSDFSRLIAVQLACSNKLYEYETENWTTRLLYDFSKGILPIQTAGDLWPYLNRSLKTVLEADRMIVSERASPNSGRIIYLAGAAASLAVGQEFPDHEGLIGWVLRKKQALLVEDFAAKENYIPRFFLQEKHTPEFKSLLAVPVIRNDVTDLVLSLESLKPNAFSEEHKQILETMAYQIAAFLDKVQLISTLEEQNLIDPKTRLGNHRAFMVELNKEIARSGEFRKKFVLQLLKVRTPPGTLEKEIADRLMPEFVSFILPLLNSINYIFRLNQDHLAILWPEKLCQEVAAEFQTVLNAIIQKTPWMGGLIEKVVVHSGMGQFPGAGQSDAELLENVQKALASSERAAHSNIEVFKNVEINPMKGD